jgi:hypothetical protein
MRRTWLQHWQPRGCAAFACLSFICSLVSFMSALNSRSSSVPVQDDWEGGFLCHRNLKRQWRSTPRNIYCMALSGQGIAVVLALALSAGTERQVYLPWLPQSQTVLLSDDNATFGWGLPTQHRCQKISKVVPFYREQDITQINYSS